MPSTEARRRVLWWGATAGALTAGAGAALLWDPGRTLAWTGGVAAAAATTYLTQQAPRQVQDALARRRAGAGTAEPDPVAVAVHIRDHDYVTVDLGDRTADVPAGGHTVRVVVTATGTAAVVLTQMRAEVVSREDLPGDLARHAAEVPVRRFEVRLDPEPPEVRALAESDFPYRLTADESEVLDVQVTVDRGVVRWVLWLDWASAGRTGSTRVDLHGSEFLTAARTPGGAR
ncbi:hypothetical protein [Streptomyces tropicalis]|uniref:Uncharacterized protein n=1 Tax=Streptomyces tropicalis TaxID=3034234 RepID=A0ABT6A199_9ACTN|nr:hypothetical protein [Streptomyces tropicalis]MDF3298418.1 hypothetical protein [Streptomyces tropicalis]